MDARAFDDSKLHGRHVTEGPARTPRRFPDIGRALGNGGDLKEVGEAGLGMRRNAGKAPANSNQSGTLRKYADQVGPVRTGAVWHAGSKAEVVGHADI